MSNAPGGAARPLHVLLSFASATAFASGSAIAPLAYRAGSDAFTINMTRAIIAALILWLVLALARVGVALPPRERRIALGLGVLNAAYSYGLYGAIEYIPVAMAVLIFYTYPLSTAAVAWVMGSERPTLRGVAALLLGLAGVALVVGAPAVLPDWRGVALAAAAALGFTILLTINARLVHGRDSRPVSLHVLGSAAACYVVLGALLQHAALPQTETGWVAFLAIPVFYSFAFIVLFIAVAALGPVRTALIMNFEPVASVVLAWLILGQALGPVQLLGAALVVAAIMLAALRRRAR